MYKLVLDLEMNGIYSKEIPMGEIIEIGAVLLDENFDIVSKYSTYVRPDNLKVSSRTKILTNIAKEDLSGAPKIGEALNKMLDISPDLSNTTLYTWSSSDTKSIISELKSKGLHNRLIMKLCKNYIDVQVIFGNKIGEKNQVNLTKALNMIGLKFDGKEHGALSDAINTARILKEIETNANIRKTIDDINSYMNSKPLTSTIGSLFNNIKLD